MFISDLHVWSVVLNNKKLYCAVPRLKFSVCFLHYNLYNNNYNAGLFKFWISVGKYNSLEFLIYHYPSTFIVKGHGGVDLKAVSCDSSCY